MKKILLFLGLGALIMSAKIWQASELIEVEPLLKLINSPNKAQVPTIINVGPMQNIKYAVTYGTASNDDAMAKIKTAATTMKKDKPVVVYCGCCKMENCPNVQPAYDYFISAGFKNVKVLNLKEDLAADWVAKKYPMETK